MHFESVEIPATVVGALVAGKAGAFVGAALKADNFFAVIDETSTFDFASTAGLSAAVGLIFWRMSKGEIVSADTHEREAKLIELVENQQAMMAKMNDLVDTSHSMADRLFSYLEGVNND